MLVWSPRGGSEPGCSPKPCQLLLPGHVFHADTVSHFLSPTSPVTAAEQGHGSAMPLYWPVSIWKFRSRGSDSLELLDPGGWSQTVVLLLVLCKQFPLSNGRKQCTAGQPASALSIICTRVKDNLFLTNSGDRVPRFRTLPCS